MWRSALDIDQGVCGVLYGRKIEKMLHCVLGKGEKYLHCMLGKVEKVFYCMLGKIEKV